MWLKKCFLLVVPSILVTVDRKCENSARKESEKWERKDV